MLYKHPWAHVEFRATDTDTLEREKKEGKKDMSEQTERFKMLSHLKERLEAICSRQKGGGTKAGVLWDGSSLQCWGRMNPCPAEGQNILWVMWSVSECWEVKRQEKVLLSFPHEEVF